MLHEKLDGGTISFETYHQYVAVHKRTT
jgi:hypothetical protein